MGHDVSARLMGKVTQQNERKMCLLSEFEVIAVYYFKPP